MSTSAARQLARTIRDGAADLDAAAKSIVEQAYENGSSDNLTAQIVRIDELPDGDAREVFGQPTELPLPPLLDARMLFDGYRIVRELHASHRSHIYLAVDEDSGTTVTIKIPSIDLRDDGAYLKRFMMEEWVARRIDSPHVLKPFLPQRKRNFLYVTMEYIDGQTLTQWMIDNPAPSLETVRDITEQIAKGLRAFHRKEMLHQDVRPDNIMIDNTGTVKIIDFGSTRIAGVAEAVPAGVEEILGTQQYTAPEYFLGDGGTARSDLFSLGVVDLSDADADACPMARRSRAPAPAPTSTGWSIVRPRMAAATSRAGSTARWSVPCRSIRSSATTASPSSCSTCAIPTQDIWRRHRPR